MIDYCLQPCALNTVKACTRKRMGKKQKERHGERNIEIKKKTFLLAFTITASPSKLTLWVENTTYEIDMKEMLCYDIPFTGKHEPNKLTGSPLCDFIAQLVRALHRQRRGHGHLI